MNNPRFPQRRAHCLAALASPAIWLSGCVDAAKVTDLTSAAMDDGALNEGTVAAGLREALKVG